MVTLKHDKNLKETSDFQRKMNYVECGSTGECSLM